MVHSKRSPLLPIVLTFPFALGLAVVSCGSESTSEPGAADGSVDAATDGPPLGDAPNLEDVNSGDATLPGPPGYGFQTIRIPDLVDDVPCSGTQNAAATIADVALGQTHVLAPTHPFFFLMEGRQAVLVVNVGGSGAAPEVSVEASAGGKVLGKKCLKGPATLPTSLDPLTADRTKTFSVTLPAAWLVQGLSLTLRAGAASRTLATSELKVGGGHTLTFITTDFLFFGDKDAPRPKDFAVEFLSKLAAARMNYGHFPVPLRFSKMAVGPDTYFGRDKNGNNAVSDAQWADRTPSCTAAEKMAGTCTTYSAFAFNIAVREMVGEFSRANGLLNTAYVYGSLSTSAGADGSGLGWGRLGSGGGYGLAFNHEMGHSFLFPHWGDVTAPKGTPTDLYPYIGDFPDSAGGGFGASMAYDPLDGAFISPRCPLDNKERQDSMQRNGKCADDTAQRPGRTYDYFSDYSDYRMSRLLLGGPSQTGTVRYRGGDVPFGIPAYESHLEWPDPMRADFRRWNRLTSTYVAESKTRDRYDLELPQTVHQPVYLVYGSFYFPSDTLSTIYPPVLYSGNVMRTFDLTKQADFDELKKRQIAYFGYDLTVKAEYTDGTVRHFLLPKDVRGTNRTNPKSPDSMTYWAVNVPADKVLAKASLLYRPIATRFAASGLEGELLDAASSITPANVYAAPRIAATVQVP